MYLSTQRVQLQVRAEEGARSTPQGYHDDRKERGVRCPLDESSDRNARQEQEMKRNEAEREKY